MFVSVNRVDEMDGTLQQTMTSLAPGRDIDDSSSSSSETEEPLRALVILHYALTIPLSLVIIIGNALLWFVLSRSHSLRPHSIVVSLAIADVLVGFTVLTNECLHPLLERLNDDLAWICSLWTALQFLPIIAMFCLMSLLSLDRYFAVTSTTYADGCIANHTRLLVCVSWLYSTAVVCVIIAMTSWNSDDSSVYFLSSTNSTVCALFIVLATHVTALCGVSCYVYVRILQTIRVHQNRIQVTNTMTYENLVSETDLAKTYFFIITITVLVWVPVTITTMTRLIYNNSSTDWFRLNVPQFMLLVAYTGNLHFAYLLLTSQAVRTSFSEHLQKKKTRFEPNRRSICRHI